MNLGERWREVRPLAAYHLACTPIVDPSEAAGQPDMASIVPYALSLYHIVGQEMGPTANYRIAGIEIGTLGTGHYRDVQASS